MTEQKLVEKMAEAMAGPLGARVPFDMLPEDASQPRLADGSRLTQEVLLDAARAALSVIREAGQKDAKEALAWMQMNMPYRYYVAVRAMFSASNGG